MKSYYPIEWVPASADYILAVIREDWKQCAMTDDEKGGMPTFATTVKQWREDLDLVWWSPLGDALNKQWGAKIPSKLWFSTLVPAADRTVGDVCQTLASQAKRAHMPPVRLLGHSGEEAGVFLAIRSLLVEAGAPPDLRPSSALAPYLRKWRKVFLKDVSRIADYCLVFDSKPTWFSKLAWLSLGIGVLLIFAAAVSTEDPNIMLTGITLFALGLLGSYLGETLIRGRMEIDGASSFRDLARLILEHQRRCGLHGQAAVGSTCPARPEHKG